jgi:hypothetical protein
MQTAPGTMKTLALPLLLFCFWLPAHAIDKCESGGRIIYSDQGCGNGRTLEYVAPAPPPDASDAASARQRAAQEKRELDRLQSERRSAQARQEREQQRIARAALARERKCRMLALSRKWSSEDAAAADLKSVSRARRNALRNVEKYEAVCGAWPPPG